MDSEIDVTFNIIKEYIDNNHNFCLDAGAGSGKTHTLIKVINYIRESLPEKKIVCITYTNNAKDEILERLSSTNNVLVSTIHDFIWRNIGKFQSSLRAEVNKMIEEKIEKFRIDGDIERLEKYQNSDLNLPILYRNYESLRNGIISHKTLLKIFKSFLNNKNFCNIMFSLFDYIFIDEYQDTDKSFFYDFLDKFNQYKANKSDILMGLFGDFMQNIYEQGIGRIDSEHQNDFKYIQKEDNYRSCKNIIKTNNCLRDDLKQVCKNKSKENGKIIFVYNQSNDLFLNNDSDYCNYKRLHLTHRVISEEIQFANVYRVYNNKYNMDTSTILKNADERFLKYICRDIMPSIYEFNNKLSNTIIKNINMSFMTSQSLKEIKERLINIVANMNSLSISDFLNKLFELKMFSSTHYKQLCQTYIDSDDNEFLKEIIDIPSLEFYNYYCQFSNRTMLETMQGTKGNEFENVLININETISWTMYNFSKLLKKDNTLKESVRERTLKLLYVSCTRAKKSLVINYIVDKEESKNDLSALLMKNNVERIWNDSIEFINKTNDN